MIQKMPSSEKKVGKHWNIVKDKDLLKTLGLATIWQSISLNFLNMLKLSLLFINLRSIHFTFQKILSRKQLKTVLKYRLIRHLERDIC